MGGRVSPLHEQAFRFMLAFAVGATIVQMCSAAVAS